MSLTKYNAKLALAPFGLRNSGVICYFNSMLQCFLSCTSVLAVFDNNAEVRGRNSLCAAVWALIQHARAGDKRVEAMSTVVWEELRRQLRAKRMTPFGQGMEDAHEGFLKFIDAFDAPELQELFEHRYKSTFQCSRCNVRWTLENNAGEQQVDTGVFCKFQREDFEQGEALERMILQREEPADDNTRCHACGEKCTHVRTDRYIFTPEVIIALFSKFQPNAAGTRFVYQKWVARAPQELTIPGCRGEIKYRMVAVAEHAGDMEGGHYWAHAARQGGTYRLDDMRVEAAAVDATYTSYMVWYHVV